jgi:2-succinyl-6-hydroxy-2,4-cyclohexadiene-1-carboxylate synthase
MGSTASARVFDRSGPSEADRQIVFLHGGGANRKMWGPVLTQLAHRRCIAIDMPGHGAHRDAKFSPAAAVEWVAPVLDRPSTLVGLSLGGYVAILLASQRPDLPIEGMVLSGASASYRGWGGRSTRLFGYALPVVHRFVARKNAEAIARIAGDETAMAMERAGMSMRAAAQALRTVPGPDYHGHIARYEGPVLILNGERDTPNNDEIASLVGLRRDLCVQILDDAGHACALSKPEAFAMAVDGFVATITAA